MFIAKYYFTKQGVEKIVDYGAKKLAPKKRKRTEHEKLDSLRD